ncbi:MAG: hypothetical protein M0Z67_15985 [Nitrospiraceae bacterium]|nr:hypothetical protein [Nitrospiraceae bacterium]
MKRLLCIAAILAVFFALAVTQAESQDDYTFISTPGGTRICLGTWVPPRSVGLAGECEGEIMTFSQLSAVSNKQSVDRLDQVVLSLEAIDQKMAINNEQISRLINATVSTQASIDRQVSQAGDFLRGAIARRFDALPKELLSNESFKEALSKLKADILAEVEKKFPARQSPPAK